MASCKGLFALAVLGLVASVAAMTTPATEVTIEVLPSGNWGVEIDYQSSVELVFFDLQFTATTVDAGTLFPSTILNEQSYKVAYTPQAKRVEGVPNFEGSNLPPQMMNEPLIDLQFLATNDNFGVEVCLTSFSFSKPNMDGTAVSATVSLVGSGCVTLGPDMQGAEVTVNVESFGSYAIVEFDTEIPIVAFEFQFDETIVDIVLFYTAVQFSNIFDFNGLTGKLLFTTLENQVIEPTMGFEPIFAVNFGDAAASPMFDACLVTASSVIIVGTSLEDSDNDEGSVGFDSTCFNGSGSSASILLGNPQATPGSSIAVFDVFYAGSETMMAPISLSSIAFGFNGNAAGVSAFVENTMNVGMSSVLGSQVTLTGSFGSTNGSPILLGQVVVDTTLPVDDQTICIQSLTSGVDVFPGLDCFDFPSNIPPPSGEDFTPVTLRISEVSPGSRQLTLRMVSARALTGIQIELELFDETMGGALIQPTAPTGAVITAAIEEIVPNILNADTQTFIALLSDLAALTPIPPVTGSADPVEGEEILNVLFPESFPTNFTACVSNAVFVESVGPLVLDVPSSFFDGNCVNLACQAEAGSGDFDGDGVTTILDLVSIVSGILGSITLSACERLIADVDGSGGDPVILDIVLLVEIILGSPGKR